MPNNTLLARLDGYWDGSFQTSDAPTFTVLNPATGEFLGELPMLDATHAGLAVASAGAVLANPQSFADRAETLRRIAATLLENREDLARIITLENGKPVSEALGEVNYSAGFYADAASRVGELAPRTLEERPRGLTWTVHHRPAGVAGLITPWNFPLAMLAKKLSGAIAAGCPSVVKPSEKTPLSAVAFFALLHQLGLPAGLVNLVFGDAPAIGGILCDDPRVRVVSFTGSTAVGRLLAKQCAPHFKKVALELGGNAPFLVFADADLDAAADQLMSNKFRCTGQTCVCTNRVLVEASVQEAFAAAVASRVKALRIGPGINGDTDIGPLIDGEGFSKVESMVADAVAQGASARVGGSPLNDERRFYPPTVLTGVTQQMRCAREEVFGPVVSILVFADEAEATAMANDTEYGLAAYVFTTDRERAQRVAAQLHFGHVGINTGSGPTPEAPFGGMRHSGLGREGGMEGILEFVEIQTIPQPAA